MQSSNIGFYIDDECQPLTPSTPSTPSTPLMMSDTPMIIIDPNDVNVNHCLCPSAIESKKSDMLYVLYTDYGTGAITPESKNSSNASLLSDTNNENFPEFDAPKIDLTDEMCEKNNLSIPNQIEPILKENSLLLMGLQMFVAFTLAGFGNVGAGLILDKVQKWNVFIVIPEMFVLVPSLLGLKGNLEMTMVSRLSTHANLGDMQIWKETIKMSKGNLALVQCQATVVSFLAAIVAIGWSMFESRDIQIYKSLVLLSSSLLTANIACLTLGLCMICVIVLCHKIDIDPDNIATPIAASLGDLTTAALLASFAQLIYNHTDASNEKFPFVSVIIIIIFITLLPLWYYLARTNSYTRSVVATGWYPVITAMIISSSGGFILDSGVQKFDHIALFQPVINGVGGNLVAVQASRISTFLHRQGKPGFLYHGYRTCIDPIRAFFSKKDINVRTAQILLLMTLPAHILYVIVIRLVKGEEDIELTLTFFIVYLSFALLQVIILLFMAYNLVHILWKWRIDPDTFAIPILTASGDFLGSAFLFCAFWIMSLL